MKMKVKAVRQLVERTGYWTCTVTLTTPGGLHKDPTVDVDSKDLEKIPRLGDVLLVYPPRIVGYASPENDQPHPVGRERQPDETPNHTPTNEH